MKMKRSCWIGAVWVVASCQMVSEGLAGQAESNAVTGWTVARSQDVTPGVSLCTATWTGQSPAELSIAAEGPLLWLTVSALAFGDQRREEAVFLKSDAFGELQRRALVAAKTYAITIDPQVDNVLLQARSFVLTIKGKDYLFAISNASAAMDAVRRCVGQPTRAEVQAEKAAPYPLPDGWNLADLGSVCAARLEGKEVDTMVGINNKDQVLLIAGHQNWAAWGGKAEITLQLDSEKPRSFEGFAFNNLVLIVLADNADVSALRKASTLKWHLPTGDYSASVHDVGPALDAATTCTKEKRAVVAH